MSLNPNQFHQQPLPFDKPVAQKVDFRHGRGWTGPKIERPDSDEALNTGKYQWANELRVADSTNRHDERQQRLEAKYLQQELKGGRPAIRFPSDVTPSIVESARFKTQHETDTTRGSLNPSLRADYEDSVFGYSKSAPVQKRPVYGYIESPDGDGGVGHYGDMKAVLKPRVLGRTTVSPGDSLTRTVPIPYNQAAAGKPQPVLHHLLDDNDVPYDHAYTEAQYHGGLGVKDIDHLELTEPHRPSYRMSKQFAKTKAAVKKTGLPWRQMRTEYTVQPPLGLEGIKAGMAPPNEGETYPTRRDQIDNLYWDSFGVRPKYASSTYEVKRSKGFKSEWD